MNGKGKVKKGKTSICIAHYGYQPPLMRCNVTDRSRLTTPMATAHSVRTQAWAATRMLARQRRQQ